MPVQLIKPLDLTGQALSNRVTAEVHALYNAPIRLYMPNMGAYHASSMVVTHVLSGVRTTLTRSVDWFALELDTKIAVRTGREIYHALMIKRADLHGDIELSYQALGGNNNVDYATLNATVTELIDGQNISWTHIDHPQEFTPAAHKQDIRDLYGLEYLTVALNRISQAVVTAQEFLHLEILSDYLPESSRELYDVLESYPQSRTDTVYFLSDLSQKQLSAQQNLIEWLAEASVSLGDRISHVDRLIDAQVRNSTGDKGALAKAAMFTSQMEHDGSLMDVPSHLTGLSAWIDFNDEQEVKEVSGELRVTDKVNPARAFTGAAGALVTVNSMVNTRACDLSKVGGGLSLTAGSGIEIKPSHTVLVVYSQSDSSTAEKFTLLSNGTGSDRLYVDNEQQIQLGYVSSSGGEYRLTGVIYDDESAHMCASSIHPRLGQCLKYSSQPSEHHPTESTYQSEVNVSTHSSVMTRMGDALSVGYLHEVLVYDRNLSRCELDVLGLYYKYKYGIEFNHISNGNFCAGMSGFTTDYVESLDAAAPGQIAVIYKIALGQQTLANDNDFYMLPNFSYILRVMAENNRFLAVNTSTDLTKAFWRSNVKLVPNGQYKLKLSVLYNQEKPPHLQLKINGVASAYTLPLDGLYTRSEDIVFDVVSPVEDATLELYNLNVQTNPNTFAVDSVALTRHLG